MKSGYLERSSSQNLFWKQIFPSLVSSWWSNILELCKIHWPNIEMATFENCNSPSILTLVRVKLHHKIYACEEMEGNSDKESWDSMSDRFKSKCSIVRTVIPVILNHFDNCAAAQPASRHHTTDCQFSFIGSICNQMTSLIWLLWWPLLNYLRPASKIL